MRVYRFGCIFFCGVTEAVYCLLRCGCEGREYEGRISGCLCGLVSELVISCGVSHELQLIGCGKFNYLVIVCYINVQRFQNMKTYYAESLIGQIFYPDSTSQKP